ncbi:RMD1 family protein [Clostridium sp. YIM B02515]|uniref:RMD1 family protein n=1 Tax=Clostridium rhizosphaerae TaxID=2803861 RepID=A0ABS1TDW6_9CLOT|nr:RMD1 family protein [Clostridium rhizosphaerae]MBL4936816.1 RMD1 family protein [Clostridium rhizosphaerae]
MQSWNFKSLVLCNEINLNKIAAHFGINKKFKWEDPLVLQDSTLKGLVNNLENKYVYVYYYGSIVFINMEHHEMMDIVNYLKNVDENLKNNFPDEYIDEYRLEVDQSYDYMLYNDLMTSNEFAPYYLDILSSVLAKSTSLRKIETDTDKLLDSIENVINYLDTGKFNMSDEEIAKTSAKVLRFKYHTISNLMLLDKPRSAWDNEDIESFFMQVTELFDFKDRYQKITRKTEVLQDITDVFASLTHEKRGTKLEIMVIVLILFELLIAFAEFIFRIH